MPTYIGFSTIQAGNKTALSSTPGVNGGSSFQAKGIINGKKFKLTDEQLVLQDFLNALNIPAGQKPGVPSYGTTIWEFIFEPNSIETRRAIEDEIRRIAKNEPRFAIENLSVYPNENGILIQLEVVIPPATDSSILQLYFNRSTSKATIVGNDY